MEKKGRTGQEMEWGTELDLVKETDRPRRKKRPTGSFGMKMIVYFLLAFSCFTAAGAWGAGILAVSEDFYRGKSLEELFLKQIRGRMINTVHEVESFLVNQEEDNAVAYCDDIGLDVDIFHSDARPGMEEYEAIRSLSVEEIDSSGFRIWGTYDGSYDASMFLDIEIYFDQSEEYVKIGSRKLWTKASYIFRVYANPGGDRDSWTGRTYEWVSVLYEIRYSLIWVALAGSVVCVLCFIFLMCAAGRHNDREGIVPGLLTNLHLDILTVFFIAVAAGILLLGAEMLDISDQPLIIWGCFSGIAALEALWLTFYCSEFALRLKLGKWWKHTVVYMVCRLCYRILRFLCRGIIGLCKGIGTLVRGIPLVMTTLICYFGICILEFMGCIAFVEAEGVVLWALEKAVLLVIVLYVALVCKKLLYASAALAEGQQEHVVDTARMFGDFKKHGENLNSIGQGIAKAVAERMKSEHMKTELITNVSHDLKTPLTSIINYADLICSEKPEDPKIAEYAEVLLRQSRRLKKLLEDLVEASKATTGNLEVNLAPCEVGVLLSQAVGEYQQRMEEKSLDLIVVQPEEPVQVMADGRHLWRVFDNLLNNVCKYAQEHSRVYLTVERKEGRALIIFRNMSKYPLNISGEELEERFVRGDRSRHMEGNGLGLSIARSLVDLQNGQMQIVIDGDLFKVILVFQEIG